MRYQPLRKITVMSAPSVRAWEALTAFIETIPEAIVDKVRCTRPKRVGGRLVAEVPTILPSIVIQRRLADAGLRAEVETILRAA